MHAMLMVGYSDNEQMYVSMCCMLCCMLCCMIGSQAFSISFALADCTVCTAVVCCCICCVLSVRLIVRNSWGEGWGDKGYCYVPYDYAGNEEFNFLGQYAIYGLTETDFTPEPTEEDNAPLYER
jgi:hypothetical protein